MVVDANGDPRVNPMKSTRLAIPDVIHIEPKVWGDARGYFYESYSRQRYEEAGIHGEFVQDNVSFSRRGVLRGLHIQNPHTQGKLVSVLAGEVFDVAVDVRKGSPTFGRWVGVTLSSEKKNQLWVPPGMAHGFVVTSETAIFAYKCTDYYAPEYEFSVAWDDPAIGINWPMHLLPSGVELSAKDKTAHRLADIDPDRLPQFRK
jgi:dTDP-4-dehydrorhamnose 3,5-epimerase